MQGNQLGLFQSLLYQILKTIPALIPVICLDRMKYEGWTIEELHGSFERIASQHEIEAKFCFFIDGLDE